MDAKMTVVREGVQKMLSMLHFRLPLQMFQQKKIEREGNVIRGWSGLGRYVLRHWE
jgi:hypothetical protein